MPLLRFDLIAGRTDGELEDLLDAAHRAIVGRSHRSPVRHHGLDAAPADWTAVVAAERSLLFAVAMRHWNLVASKRRPAVAP